MKNSWGDTWGLNGFILLERADSEEEAGGECGLLIEAVYPVLATPAEEPLFDPEFAVLRPDGFESSATAKDCGGGTSEIVFNDGERDARVTWCFVPLILRIMVPDEDLYLRDCAS